MREESIASISEFLVHAGTDFRIVDLGRGVDLLETQQFLEIENATMPAPRPRQQHAWFGIVFWNKQASAQHYIWFIKLPLDEQGLVMSAGRNHFLQIVVEALGSSLADDSDKAETLPDNPYSFVPPQTQMAQFHAVIKTSLGLPPSQDAAQVRAYLLEPNQHNWQALSVQGIADVCATGMDNELVDAILSNYPMYAPALRHTLLGAMEAVSLPDVLLNYLTADIRDEELTHVLRGISENEPSPVIAKTLNSVLQKPERISLDVLSIIAARHYMQLDGPLLQAYFEAVAAFDEANSHNFSVFSGLFSDLVQIPLLRPRVLALLRSENRSDALSRAIGHLFNQRG